MAKSKRQQREKAKMKRQEKQFFMWVGIVTLIALALCYIFFIRG